MATYSALDDQDVARLEKMYGMRLSGLAPLVGGMATSSFIADSARGKVVISILDNQDDEAAQRLAQTVDHMWRNGVPTCRVVPLADGSLLSRLGPKSVLVKEYIPGRTLERLPDRMLPQAAGMLAHIHGIPHDDLDVPVGLRRLSPDLQRILDDFPDVEHAAWVRNRLTRIDTLFPEDGGPRRDRWTIIHGDFTTSNIVVAENDQLFAIDWETVTVDDPMLDCGMSALSLCITDQRIDPDRLHLFAEGYSAAGRDFEHQWIRAAVEYAAVIVSFHRYRRHHMRFPNPSRFDYFRVMVDFVEREFPVR